MAKRRLNLRGRVWDGVSLKSGRQVTDLLENKKIHIENCWRGNNALDTPVALM